MRQERVRFLDLNLSIKFTVRFAVIYIKIASIKTKFGMRNEKSPNQFLPA